MSKSDPQFAIQERFLDQPYQLAERLIDPVSGTLSWQGKREHLRRKELEVLALLASAEGKQVSRDNFIAVVWQGNDLVGDRGLSNTIVFVRKSLRDEDTERPIIRTIPRRGYQLAVPVLEPTEPAAEAVVARLEPGEMIPECPGWRLVKRLGELNPDGGLASDTWLAEPSEFGEREQGLRVFRFCRSEAHLQRLRREVTLLRYVRDALAENPRFAVIRDWQLEEPPYFLARDYTTFGSLRQWNQLAEQPFAGRIRMMSDLSEAVAAMHVLGVVHRQLNVDTILVDQSASAGDALPQLKISAFELAALSDRRELAPLNITAAGLTLGAEEAIVKPAAAEDIGALGLVFLQITLGNWRAEAKESWLIQVSDADLQTLLRRCVGPTSERPSAAELAGQLYAMAEPNYRKAADVNAREKADAAPKVDAAQKVDASQKATVLHAVAPAADLEDQREVQVASLERALRIKSAQANAATAKAIKGLENIGPYRLLDQLGEGGMGTVYLAEQRDPYRKVALKIIRSGLDGKQILSRFDAERQALAMMNHPNVASVHDSGLADDGRPYFAMEYIAGDDIASHCDTHHLNINERIKLFLQVCDGVLHAHQKGVLHRDIKPSNLMVSSASESAGTVKIIDFGLAKSLHGKLASQTLHTSFGAFVGTPIYSSPEHVSGTASGVDTRSDIYSMGVVLYELLAGSTPIASESLENLEPEKVRELVCKSKLPSMREQLQNTSAEKRKELAEHRAIKVDELPKTLEGDLSWVVGKCLERDPNDRYASVLALKEDLQRWLEVRPVEARPTTGAYRFRKWVRRNRGMSSLIAASVATILLTTSAAIMGYLRAESALEASRLAEAEATAAADFQVKQMDTIDPGAMGLTLRERLIEAVQKRSSERGWELAAITQGQQQLSTLLEGVNFTDLSLGQLDTHQFQPTLASISKNFKDQPLLQARLWQSLADSLVKLGRAQAAIEPQRLAFEQRQRLLGADDPLTLFSLRRRGSLRMRQGQIKEAEVDVRKALAGMQSVLGINSPETLRTQLALGQLLYMQDRLEESQKITQQALDGARSTLKPDDPLLFHAYSSMSVAALANQNYPEAEKFIRLALEGNRRVYGEDSRQAWVEIDNLAVLFVYTGRYAEAEELLVKLLTSKRASLGEDHDATQRTQTNLSELYSLQGRLAESEEMSRQLLHVMQRTSGVDHADTLSVAISLAYLLQEQGKTAEAVELGRQTLAIGRNSKSVSEDHIHKYTVALAVALRLNGEFGEANALLREVLKELSRTLGPKHPFTLSTVAELASVLEAQSDLAGAESLLRDALSVRREALGSEDPGTVATIDQLAGILRQRGNLEEASALGLEAIKIASAQGNVVLSSVTLYQIHHARTLTDLRQFDEAEKLLEKAKTALTQDPYPMRKSVQALAEAYIELYTQQHKTQPGLGFEAKAQSWQKKLDALKNEPNRLAKEILSDERMK